MESKQVCKQCHTENFNLLHFHLYMKQFFPDFLLKLSEEAAALESIYLGPSVIIKQFFTENVQWRVTSYFHFILSRKKKHTAQQERLNSTKATFQLSPKRVVCKTEYFISWCPIQTAREWVFHTDWEQNMQVLGKDNFSFPSRNKETDLNTSKPDLKVSSSLQIWSFFQHLIKCFLSCIAGIPIHTLPF